MCHSERTSVGQRGVIRFLAAGVCAAALIAVGSGCDTNSQSVHQVPPEKPRTVAGLTSALSHLHMYGPVTSVSGATESTMGKWRESEPGNTSGYARNSPPDASTVYAVVVSGRFKVNGPMRANGEEAEATFDQGRIVFDEAGNLLNVRLWSSSTPVAELANAASARSPFGSAFDNR